MYCSVEFVFNDCKEAIYLGSGIIYLISLEIIDWKTQLVLTEIGSSFDKVRKGLLRCNWIAVGTYKVLVQGPSFPAAYWGMQLNQSLVKLESYYKISSATLGAYDVY